MCRTSRRTSQTSRMSTSTKIVRAGIKRTSSARLGFNKARRPIVSSSFQLFSDASRTRAAELQGRKTSRRSLERAGLASRGDANDGRITSLSVRPPGPPSYRWSAASISPSSCSAFGRSCFMRSWISTSRIKTIWAGRICGT